MASLGFQEVLAHKSLQKGFKKINLAFEVRDERGESIPEVAIKLLEPGTVNCCSRISRVGRETSSRRLRTRSRAAAGGRLRVSRLQHRAMPCSRGDLPSASLPSWELTFYLAITLGFHFYSFYQVYKVSRTYEEDLDADFGFEKGFFIWGFKKTPVAGAVTTLPAVITLPKYYIDIEHFPHPEIVND
ncbi:hypothetical protein scyTo_0018230 [Scyliorhinus torazame]|uniref:Uncharacterized protein n=1 Tax=Scyliorhinus torazame TaxID=75743 RepID=A0A401PR22_SCYTO|nr:hypothetical protein [Scyliorhinus torazame]